MSPLDSTQLWRAIARSGVALALAVPLVTSAAAQAAWTNAGPKQDQHCGPSRPAPHTAPVAFQSCVIMHGSPSGAYVQGAVRVSNTSDNPRRLVTATGYTSVWLDGRIHRSDNCGPIVIAGRQTRWCYGKTTWVAGHNRPLYAIGYVWSGAGLHDRLYSAPWSTAPPSPTAARPGWVPARYWPLLTSAAAREGLDARVLAAQLKIESNFRPTVCSRAGACGIAQFLPGTWRGSWNPYLGVAGPRGYNNPTYAIPAQARYMLLRLRKARTVNGAALRARLARRHDIPASTLKAIDFSDPYQIALMAYHGGWGLDGWGPRTAKYPVTIMAQARRP
jgi:Transglycosylase SLT domain